MTISANCGTPTREDIITSIYTLKGVSSENSNYGNKFSDWSEVDENSKSAMEWAIENGIIKGYNDNTIRPRARNKSAGIRNYNEKSCIYNY